MASVKSTKQVFLKDMTVNADMKVNGSITGARREVLRQSVFGTTRTLDVAESGALVLLDADAVTTITLPRVTASDIGISYTFLESLASDEARKIQCGDADDLLVGGVTLGFDGASTDATGTYAFISTGAADFAMSFNDDLTNGAGGLGSIVTVTAILTGNTGTGDADKLVWAVEGRMVAQAENSNGSAIFTTT
jgi:hypothetical protein